MHPVYYIMFIEEMKSVELFVVESFSLGTDSGNSDVLDSVNCRNIDISACSLRKAVQSFLLLACDYDPHCQG